MLCKLIKYSKILFIIVCFALIALFNTSCGLKQLVENQQTEKIKELETGVVESEKNLESDRVFETEEINSNETGYQQVEESEKDFKSYSNFEKITMGISHEITSMGDTRKVEFISILPGDYNYRQRILNYNYSIEPSVIYSLNGNTYAKFIISNPSKYFSIDIDMEIEIYDFDLNLVLLDTEKLSIEKIALDNLKQYLKPEPNIEVNDSKIKDIASTFSASSQLELVREIYNFVLDNMTYYGYNPGNTGAAGAFSAGGGDCTEYSDLFVALCRAKNIPARVIEGYVIDAAPGELSFGHNWSEVYLENLGWIPFDTIYDDNNGNSKSTTFDNLKNIYVYTSFIRNDAELFNFHYYAYVYYGDNIEVNKSVSIK